MYRGIIQLSYRKLIDIDSQKPWERFVFDDTHQEFYMQAQTYSQQGLYVTFDDIRRQNPNAGERLSFLTSQAATGYLRQLDGLMPDVLNASGKRCLPFGRFVFEIIQSHLTDKAQHRVAITFFSDPITWLDTIGEQLLLAYGDQRAAIRAGQEIATDLVLLQPFLSIFTYQAETQTL